MRPKRACGRVLAGRIALPDRLCRRLAALIAALLVPAVAAAGRDARFRVEVALLAHEAHTAAVGRPPARLLARIRSDLGVLGFEARSYCDRAGCATAPIKTRIAIARKALGRGAMQTVWREMRVLHHRFPVDFRGMLPLRPTGPRWREGAFLYKRLCATCHAAAGPGSPVPNLFALARRESPADLVVEILAGVRGTRATGYANPLSRRQIASLADYLVAPRGTPRADAGPQRALGE